MKLVLLALALQGLLAFDSLTTEEGLPNNGVTDIFSDSRGELWLGTTDGLARYDGERIVTYSMRDGLPDSFISFVQEDHRGRIWIGTAKGLVRLDASSRRGALFRKYSDVSASDMVEDARHRLWVGCGRNLCFIDGDTLKQDPTFHGNTPQFLSLSRDGVLWAGTRDGLLRRVNGTWMHHAVYPHREMDSVEGMMIDDDGRAWLSRGFGVFIVGRDVFAQRDARPFSERIDRTVRPGEAIALPRPHEIVFIAPPRGMELLFPFAAYRARDGVVWIPSGQGVLRVADGRVTLLDPSAMMPNGGAYTFAEDAAGNLWIGTAAAGALRIPATGSTRFTHANGLGHDSINAIFEDHGTICATSANFYLNCLEGDAFHAAPMFTKDVQFRGWSSHQSAARDANGEWWFASGDGAVHWPLVRNARELAHAKPLEIDRTLGGPRVEEVFRVYRDRRGDIWFSAFGRGPYLRHRDSVTRAFTLYGRNEGIDDLPTAFLEDARGTLWLGFYKGGVARFEGGRATRIENANLPGGLVQQMLLDARGNIWMITAQGVARIDSAMRVERYSTNDGLAAPGGGALAELRDGRIAIASHRGVDLLDAATREVTHLGPRDGLPRNGVGTLLRDANGALWLGSMEGLWRMSNPPARSERVPRAPRFERVEIGGAAMALPELGAASLDGVRLAYPERRMTIAFSAPHFDSGGPLRFEYRLDGDERWIDAGEHRSVSYDALAYGAHRFEVRARSGARRVSPAAVLTFEVVPPFWRRLWFQSLAIASVIAAALLLHRMRVRHLIALHEVRNRVATDLHDDLGSNLSRISMLTELAKSRVAQSHVAQSESEPLLDEIGETARGLVDSLGDSIWAIDPKRDDVRSLLARVRHFGASLLEARDIAMDFRVADDAAHHPLGPETRRDVYLVLKEALHNAARHSGAKRVAVTAGVDGQRLRITVADDGRGFDARTLAPREDGGRGLPSMHERAARAGGTLRVESAVGAGTRIEISVPV